MRPEGRPASGRPSPARDPSADHEAQTVAAHEFNELPAPVDPTSEQIMWCVEVAGTLDFWDDPQEDIYTRDDGEPV